MALRTMARAGGNGAEAFNASFTLPGKLHAGGDHRLRLLGEPQRKNHHASGGKKNVMVHRNALPGHQAFHGGDGGGGAAGLHYACGVLEGIQAAHEHADEVHEVVARKGQGQGEGAGQHGQAQDVRHEQVLEQEHEHGKTAEGHQQGHAQVLVNVLNEGRLHQSGFLQALEHGKVGHRRHGDAAPEAAEPLEAGLVFERKRQAGNPHDDGAHREGDGYGKENAGDDFKRLVRIDEVPHGLRHVKLGNLEQGRRHGGAQNAEHQGNGGGRGKAECIEGIQEYHLADHHPQEEQHHFVVTEHVRVKNAVAGHLHHAAGEAGAHQHADGSHGQDHPHGGGLGTNGGVEEVDGVIRYAVDQVKCRQKQQGYDDNPVN